MPKFFISTVGDPEGFIFEGENAGIVFNAIDKAGSTGTGWAFAKLINGKQVFFVMQNVAYFSYEEGESYVQ